MSDTSHPTAPAPEIPAVLDPGAIAVTATILDGWIELDADAWIGAHSSGENTALTELYRQFETVLDAQTCCTTPIPSACSWPPGAV
jgi:hypothetical protein